MSVTDVPVSLARLTNMCYSYDCNAYLTRLTTQSGRNRERRRARAEVGWLVRESRFCRSCEEIYVDLCSIQQITLYALIVGAINCIQAELDPERPKRTKQRGLRKREQPRQHRITPSKRCADHSVPSIRSHIVNFKVDQV